MERLKQWCVPFVSVIMAVVVVVAAWYSSRPTAAYANPGNSISQAQVEETRTEYSPPPDGATVYGKPPQELLDLIASQQGWGTVSTSDVKPAATVVTVTPAPVVVKPAEGESLVEYPVYDRGGWEAVFNHMPEEVTPQVNSARTVTFSNGVKAHICWCLGMRVQTYDPTVDIAGETDEGFTFYQHPITRDLIITDNKTLVASHNAEENYTWTFSYDGSRAIRHKDFSFYAFAGGRWTVAENGGSTEIKKNGVFQPGVFDKTYGDWTLDDIIRVNDEMTQRFMTWLLPLNWEEVPWLQEDESIE